MGLDRNQVPTTKPRLDYRKTFGWPVLQCADGLKLVIGSGIAGVALPRAMAEPVVAGLARQGCSSPAVTVPARAGMVVILLAEADTLSWLGQDLPAGVRVLVAGTQVPMPDERRPDDLVRWLVAPNPGHRWLPSLTALLTTIRNVGLIFPRSARS